MNNATIAMTTPVAPVAPVTTTPIITTCLICDDTTHHASQVCDECHDHPDTEALLAHDMAQASEYGEQWKEVA